MLDLLEITGDDIALLNDTDLRTLIGLLCEADFRLAGLSTSGIIWGGHQDASDEGIDVTVRINVKPPKHSLIPRKTTGFQVKKPDMTPAKIKSEMKPKGKLREEIKALIKKRGAYIIVNSTGSVTDKALQNRLDAMRDAVANIRNHRQLLVDFLDRGRIASWVRTHSFWFYGCEIRLDDHFKDGNPTIIGQRQPQDFKKSILLTKNQDSMMEQILSKEIL